jgi:hypothetical protein
MSTTSRHHHQHSCHDRYKQTRLQSDGRGDGVVKTYIYRSFRARGEIEKLYIILDDCSQVTSEKWKRGTTSKNMMQEEIRQEKIKNYV